MDYVLHLAPPLVLDGSSTVSTVVLEPDSLPSGLGTQLCVLGVRFYQAVDGALYVLNAKDSGGYCSFKMYIGSSSTLFVFTIVLCWLQFIYSFPFHID